MSAVRGEQPARPGRPAARSSPARSRARRHARRAAPRRLGRRGRAGGARGPRPAPLGHRARPALRLQRRRERALRAAARSACSGTAGTRTTSSTRRPTRTCCTSSSRSGSAGARAWPTPSPPTRPRCSSSRGSRRPWSGTLAVWLLYLAGARLFDRRVGLLAAALLAVAFLPVFYSQPRAQRRPDARADRLALWGVAGVLRRGWTIDYLIAGVGLGLACATKYTGGHRAAAAARRRRDVGRARAAASWAGRRWPASSRSPSSSPPTPTRCSTSRPSATGCSTSPTRRATPLGKLGLTQDNGFVYYLWTFTWGLGWAPLALAVAGLGLLARDDRRALAVLGPAPILFVAFMGSQERFFGRWLLPVFPIVCLLAAYAVVRLVGHGRRRGAPRCARRSPRWGPSCCCGQGSSTPSTAGSCCRARTRATSPATGWSSTSPSADGSSWSRWCPTRWATDVGRPSPLTANGNRWVKFPTSRSNVANDGSFIPGDGRVVNIEDYERTLFRS